MQMNPDTRIWLSKKSGIHNYSLNFWQHFGIHTRRGDHYMCIPVVACGPEKNEQINALASIVVSENDKILIKEAG